MYEASFESKTYSTFPRGIESQRTIVLELQGLANSKTYSTFPRGIERNPEELLMLLESGSKTYSTFPRGIESLASGLALANCRQAVRPIRHSHGELKVRNSPYAIPLCYHW